MTSYLLIASEGIKLILYYGVCLGVILLALVVTLLLKYKTKQEMRVSTVKKSSEKARAYAQFLLENKAKSHLFGSAKLLKLNGLVEDAAWLAFQIFENKKDIVFEGIAGALDSLATALSKETSNGYVSMSVYEETLRHALDVLDGVIAKMDGILANR